MVNFLGFERFNSVAVVNIGGYYSPDWAGLPENSRYEIDGNIVVPAGVGSGWKIISVRLNTENAAGTAWSNHFGDQEGYVYCLLCQRHNVIYAGVTKGTLINGVFGNNGRLTHHIRKLLASRHGRTNHVYGWRNHAEQRAVHTPQEAINSALLGNYTEVSQHLFDRIYLAVAHVEQPSRVEHTILDAFRGQFQGYEVLNDGYGPVEELILPIAP